MSIVGNFVIASAVAVWRKRKIEECYAGTAILLMLVLYIPGLYVSLFPGVIGFWLLTLGSIAYLLWAYRKKKAQLSKSLVTPGMAFLTACVVLFSIYCINRGIDHSDDFYCWNLRVKNMVFFNRILGVPSTALGDHPPIIAVWDYLAVKTWRGKVSQGLCLLAQNVFLMSLFAPVLSKIWRKEKLKTVIVSLILIIIPLMDGNAYHTLLPDVILGGTIFYCLYMYWKMINSHEILYSYNFVLGVICLSMTKRIGPVFVAFVMLLCCHIYCWSEDKRVFFSLVAAAGCSIIAIYSWFGVGQNFYIMLFGTGMALISGYIIHSTRRQNVFYIIICLILLFCGVYIGFHYSDSRDHLKYVIDVITNYSKPSFLESVADILIIGGIWIKRTKIFEKLKQGIEWKNALWAYSLGVIVYILLIWYLEITVIGPANEGMTGLNIRYFLPLLIPMYGFIVCYVLQSNVQQMLVVLLAIFLLLHSYTNEQSTYYNLTHKATSLEFNEFSKNNITLSSTDHIYLIDENDGYGLTDRAFYNYICPARSQFGQTYNFITRGSGGEMPESLMELTSQLINGNYNYVYVQLISQNSINKYHSLFESMEDIGNGRLYSVENNDGKIILKWLQHE